MAQADSQAGCARCKVPLEGPANAKPSDRFTCPSCGLSDTLQNVEREILQQMEEQAEDQIFGGLRSSKHFKVERKSRPKRTYRFVILPK